MLRYQKLLLLALFSTTIAWPLRAQQTNNEVWSDVDFYANLTSSLRASWFTSHATNRDSNGSSWEFGPNLDIYLKSIRHHESQTLDKSKRKYLSMRLGYHILPMPLGNTEQRGIFEITGRYYLPSSFLLSERNRLDFRGQSNFSWRYRNRLTLERDVRLRGAPFAPYVRAEAFYNITSGNWNRFAYSGGIVFSIAKHFELEPYFERQTNTGSSPQFVNGFGATLSIYF